MKKNWDTRIKPFKFFPESFPYTPYDLEFVDESKRNAQKIAKSWRKKKFNVRIVKHKSKKPTYFIYTREARR